MSENPNGCNKDGTSRIVAEKRRRTSRLGMAWCLLCAIALGATLCVPALATTTSPECLRTLAGHTSEVYSVAFSPDGTTLASGSTDSTIKLWSAATGNLLRTLTGHTSSVHSVAFSSDGTALASGSFDRTIKLWNVATGGLLHTLTDHTGWVNSVAFSPDGTALASGSLDSTIKLWNVATGGLLRTLTGHPSEVYSVAFSPDGTTLASGSRDYTVKLWNVATGGLLRTLTGHTSLVLSVALSPDGTTVASGSTDTTIKLWNAATGSLLRTLTGHTGSVYSVAFSPGGTTLASGSYDNTISLWNVATGGLLHSLTGHTSAAHSVAFSPDGTTVASGADDSTIKLWDVRAFSTSAPTPPCPGTYSISPISASVSHTGNSATIRVTAQSGCSWSALSQSTWIDITSGPGGSGNGTVTYTVDANSATKLRIGMMTIAGTTFTVIQDAPPTRPPSSYSPLDVHWEGKRVEWQCNEARGACSVSIEVTIENTGHTTSAGTVCWVGLNEVGNWYYAQTDYRPVDIKPGEKWTFTPVLVCPLNIWTRIDIQVRNDTGVVFEEESRVFFIP